MGVKLSTPRNELIISAAVVVGVFPLSYIITTYVMRHRNKYMGYPASLPIKNIPLCT